MKQLRDIVGVNSFHNARTQPSEIRNALKKKLQIEKIYKTFEIWTIWCTKRDKCACSCQILQLIDD